jgi:POT family proton-dependent oligopeptide transporter
MSTQAQPAAAAASTAVKDRYPPQIFYIVGNEGAERFSYYGMTSILTLYMARWLKFPDEDAVALNHVFSALVYVAPLFGGWLSDRFIGRYKTILWVSFAYVAGHAVLAVWEGKGGLYAGCLLIALGAGGIKPCVSAFVGDQFNKDQQHLLERAYGWFYFSINTGSIVAQFLIPKLLDWYGPAVAFGVPGVAMAVALAIYVAGRRLYVKLPPTGENPNSFLKVVAASGGNLESVKGRFPEEALNGVRATLRIALVFAMVSVFWALFFQYGSSWVLQAEKMDRQIFEWTLNPAQLSTFNALFVLTLIPVMNAIYAALEQRGRKVTPLQKMTYGMFIAVTCFLAAAVVEWAIAGGGKPHALWQVPQYFLLSLAEVLISVTGLEFAYTQAPPSMKSTIMGLWYVAISVGNLLTAVVAKLVKYDGPGFFLVFVGLMLVAAVVFALIARWYRPAFQPSQPSSTPA